MRKFCIIATPKSEIALSESKVFVFSSEMLEHAAKHGNLIMFDCSKFSVDEEASSANWREVFNFNEEPPRGVIVTVNNDYKSGIVMRMLFEGFLLNLVESFGADEYWHHFFN